MKKLLFLLALLLSCMNLPAQDTPESGIPFNGLAIDANGKGVKVKVSVKNSDKRTTADSKGRFGLTDIAATDTLVMKYKGESVEIPVEGRHSMKIIWTPDHRPSYSEDQDLVDSGYGYVKRREYTGESTGLTGESLRQKGFTDLQTAILTLVPSAQLIHGEIVLRGLNSINSSSAALIICDGTPISNLNNISIYDVKTVEIQKGSNMYGVRGANGVIIIRTR